MKVTKGKTSNTVKHVLVTTVCGQFNIDTYLEPILPPSIVPHLPRPIAHFLGHRTRPPRQIGTFVLVGSAFVGVFCGVSVINVVCDHLPALTRGVTPIDVGSFGASAVLVFFAIESPLAQPRNVVLGHLIASIIGVGIAKLFALAGAVRFEQLRWLAGALACAIATSLMALTGTVHPPAGGTALVAVTNGSIVAIGWSFVPAVLLLAVLMIAVGLVVNNLPRRYPIYWWSPEALGHFWRKHALFGRRRRRRSSLHATPQADQEAQTSPTIPTTPTSETLPDEQNVHIVPSRTQIPHMASISTVNVDEAEPDMDVVSFTRTISRAEPPSVAPEPLEIILRRNSVMVPDSVYLRPEERLVLETLSERL